MTTRVAAYHTADESLIERLDTLEFSHAQRDDAWDQANDGSWDGAVVYRGGVQNGMLWLEGVDHDLRPMARWYTWNASEGLWAFAVEYGPWGVVNA